jgi:hypothetical protein
LGFSRSASSALGVSSAEAIAARRLRARCKTRFERPGLQVTGFDEEIER